MIAIQTKYIGPSNTRGARIVASTSNGHRLSVPYDHAGEPHRKAAIALARKMSWTGTLAEGGTKQGQVFVFVDEQSTFTV
jgi:hypothetical protein